MRRTRFGITNGTVTMRRGGHNTRGPDIVLIMIQ